MTFFLYFDAALLFDSDTILNFDFLRGIILLIGAGLSPRPSIKLFA